ncbi:stalk domain-containing protein [Brevibacillus laterosporus]|uniref:stalk domain-containing protein n=1 Tax=Brevibacillus laterosporus TaxID=1465 RepID=UPI0003691E1A|nr:stalk domain-containing protein [Brevibacillus laterosporus]ATO51074.1 copper amine oxidase [Brevibacillus laterosporus DSM 25]MBG9774176.1 copper amine oxidase [Brevibacillus laterosporus]MBG9802463.1 copper amine oxidase [Brevibacillus laterosporus]MED2004300.1 stalk domain-containing protein [Brevibacillus laterosporus]MED4763662.1 stalk domain-containing protein [Brevibacillus laterosporus]
MKQQLKRGAFLLLASTLAITPLVSVPQSTYAAKNLSIDADDTDTEEKTTYTLKFKAGDDLKKGDKITVKFDSDFDLKNVKKSSIEIDGDSIKDLKKSGSKLTITIPSRIDEGDRVEIEIDDVINPDDSGEYDISVDDGDDEAEESIKIGKGKSSSSKSKTEKSAFSVDFGSKYQDEKTSLEISRIDLNDKLDDSKYVEVTFPYSSMLPNRISTSDVELNGYSPKDVEISGRTVKIKPGSKADGDKKLTIKFNKDAGIRTPSSSSSFKVEVDYKNTTYVSKEFELKKGSSSVDSDYSVTLSDSNPGARTSVSMEVKLKDELRGGNDIYVEFPTQDMVPGYIFSTSATINGTAVRSIGVSGRTVTLSTPYNFSSSDRVRIEFKNDAFIKMPTSTGNYDLAVKYRDTTYRSKSFSVTAGGVTPTNPTNPTSPTNPTVPVIPANNSTATVSLSKPNPNAITGMTVGIKALGVGLSTADYIEVVMPTSFRVPTTIPTTAVTVNGTYPSYVGTRGQNLVIYPSVNLPAGQAVSVAVNENAKIQTPGASNIYNVGVYTSAEKNPLFIRQVTVGAQNGISFKVGAASFKTQGKTYPLAVAPYTLNGNTMVPATFVRDGLKVSTTYTKAAATVKHGNTTMTFKVGSNVVNINGKNYTLPSAVQLKNNVPMLPIRTITDNLRFNLAWDNASSSVIIFK